MDSDVKQMADDALNSSLDKLAKLSAGDQELIDEFHAQVQERIAEEQRRTDPTATLYLKRMDTGKVIKSDEEYQACLQQKIPISTMTYSQAIASLDDTIGERRKREKVNKRKKAAKAARRRNRGR